jgi:phosphoserine phosphatase RsbU/P
VSAFLGLLDTRTHEVKYHAAGQGPLLHLHADSGQVSWYGATTIPMGALALAEPDAAHTIQLAPGDVLGLISDGVYEYENVAHKQFGEQRVAELIGRLQQMPMRVVAETLLAELREFGGNARQADDITIVLLRRLPA